MPTLEELYRRGLTAHSNRTGQEQRSIDTVLGRKSETTPIQALGKKFNSLPARNAYIQQEWDKRYKPQVISAGRNKRGEWVETSIKGLGKDYDKYNRMSPEAKAAMLTLGYKNKGELDSGWKTADKTARSIDKYLGRLMPVTGVFKTLYDNIREGATLINGKPKEKAPTNKSSKWLDLLDKVAGATDDVISPAQIINQAFKARAVEKNTNLLGRIYDADGKLQASKHKEEEDQLFLNTWNSMSDVQVRDAFVQMYTRDSYIDNDGSPNLGINKWASEFGDGSDEQMSAAAKQLSITDMRRILARKATLEKYMPKEQVAELLNNEAKDFISAHQSGTRKIGLGIRDFGIATLSYLADKSDSIYTLGLAIADTDGKPKVWVDDQGQVIANSRIVFNKGTRQSGYWDQNGKFHPAYQQEVSRVALHEMGLNEDGRENTGYFANPLRWSRAEQFGTLDLDAQKQYEALGGSPYQIEWGANEDSNIAYETAKMVTFGIGDQLTNLIPFGIGATGRALNTASKAGKLVSGLGKTMSALGSALSTETRFGQILQGTLGATAIANAYSRNGFLENMEKNRASLEESTLQRSIDAVSSRYLSDAEFKKTVDSESGQLVSQLRNRYNGRLASGDSISQYLNNPEALKEIAKEQVLQKYIKQYHTDLKSSQEYADAAAEAVNSAGRAALLTYGPEALKYGLVNTMGFRKWLYTNPTGVVRKVSPALKGLREFTAKEGLQRIGTTAVENLTNKQKMAKVGKIAAKQFWEGAWTNGTDDMMTEAAGQVNEDGFHQYLHAYETGEHIADVYNLASGIYSYMQGLGKALGEEHTWQAGLVGGLGSIFTFSPNFANIASFATKEGREAYRRNYQQRIVRDPEGFAEKDSDGKPVIKDVGWRDNWRDRISFFVQNGVLSEYYGGKQNNRSLQEQADYFNDLLDYYNDFRILEDLVASDSAMELAKTPEELSTLRFVKALTTYNALKTLANDKNNVAQLSSVVSDKVGLIERIAEALDSEGNVTLGDQETQQLLAEYYSANRGVPRTEENDQKALRQIVQNAKDFKEAYTIYEDAEGQIAKWEKSLKREGITVDPAVKDNMRIHRSISAYLQEKLNSLKQDISDTSGEQELAGDELLATIGSVSGAESTMARLEHTAKRLEKKLEKQQVETSLLQKSLAKAVEAADDASSESVRGREIQETIDSLRIKYEDAKLQEESYQEAIAQVKKKKEAINDALISHRTAAQQAEGNKEKGNSKQPRLRVLTAEEIFNLPARKRADMLNRENRHLYSPEQQKEINRLEQQLRNIDEDHLNKIQGIAYMQDIIKQSDDAYSKMANNPEAAAERIEAQRKAGAERSKQITNERNSQTLVDFVREVEDLLDSFGMDNAEDRQNFVYRSLRRYNKDILQNILNERLLPEHEEEVKDALDWVSTVTDLDAVIQESSENADWQENISRTIAAIVEEAQNENDILTALEKVVDDTEGSQSAQDVDKLLKGLEQYGHQRNATVIEDRKQRKERETAEAQRKKKAEEDAKIAAAEAQAKAQEAANAQPNRVVGENDRLMELSDEIPLFDDKDDTAKEKTSKSESINGNNDAAHGREKAKDAAQLLLKRRTGEVSQVFHRDEVGDISLIYGDDKGGLKHMVMRHVVEQSDFDSVDNMMDSIEDTILHGELTQHGDNHIFEKNGYRAIVVKDSDGNYVLTAYDTTRTKEEKRRSEADASRLYQNIFGIEDGNLVPQSPTSESKVTHNSENSQENDTKNGESSVSNNMGNSHIADNGDSVQGKSVTIEEQMLGGQQAEDKEIHVSKTNTDYAAQNGIGEHLSENSVTQLGGNAMIDVVIDKDKENAKNARYGSPVRYDKDLSNDGVIVHKRGGSPTDNMSRFYNWMDAAGIKLQNIIDRELSQILQNNPHAKVKFMVARPENNATKDGDMKTHLMLVLDYDDSINRGITSTHKDENGGVFSSDGKQYLVIGIVGDMGNAQMRELRDILFTNDPKRGREAGLPGSGYGLVKQGQKEFFDSHPNERFYVPQNLSTEVVPASLIPGYIVKQLKEGDVTEFRSITELLADKNRNPLGLKMDELGWGISEMTQFMTVGPPPEDVMSPQNREANNGRAFVLIPASNGKMMPSYLKPLFYNEMREGILKDKINDALVRLTAPDYQTRYDALVELIKILYLDKDVENILVGKDNTPKMNTITFKRGDTVVRSFTLDDNFDRMQFMEAFAELNPRVNITKSVLYNKDGALQQYDEAGALMTDIALLHTAGSSYRIFGLDAKGNMLSSGPVNNSAQRSSSNSDFRNEGRNLYPYKYQMYHYDKNEERYYLNGTPISDATIIRNLEYNRRIVEGGLIPVESKEGWDTYILGSKERPEVVQIHTNTKEVKVFSDAQAVELIDRVEKEAMEKERENAAKDALRLVSAEDVDLLIEGAQSMVIDDETGEMITPDELRQRQAERDVQLVEKEKKDGEEEISTQPQYEKNESYSNTAESASEGNHGTTQTFNTLAKSKTWRKQIHTAIRTKWPDTPTRRGELEKFLREHNVEVDVIGTSDAAVQAWIDTITNCR